MDERHTWLIIGGTNGLGLSIAREAMKNGQEIVACGRRVPKEHHGIHFLQLDLLQPNGLSDLRKELEQLPAISTLMFCAARIHPSSINEKLEDLRETVRLNFWSILDVIHNISTLLRTDARIFAVGSENAYHPQPETAAYDISKLMLFHLPTVIALLLPERTRCHVIIPPKMKTRLHKDDPNLIEPNIVAKKIYQYSCMSNLESAIIRLDEPLTAPIFRHGENPVGPSPRVLVAMRHAAYEDTTINIHPVNASSELELAIRSTIGLGPDMHVIPSCGGSGAILHTLLRHFARPGREIVLLEPGFSMLRLWAKQNRYSMIEIDIKPDMQAKRIDVEQVLGATSSEDPVYYIINPGGISAWYLDKADGDTLIDSLPKDAVLILDEAYMEWTSDDIPIFCLAQSDKRRQVIGLRTFSKAHGLADLRLGYAYVNKEICKELGPLFPPHRLSSYITNLAHAALEDVRHLDRSKMFVQIERSRIQNSLPDGIHLLMGWTPQLIFQTERSWHLDLIKSAGFNPRRISGDIIQLSLGTKPMNDLLIEVLQSQ